MFRGEFRFHDGRVVPNNLTAYGRREILRGAFAGNARVATAAGGSFWVGLCTALPSDALRIENIAEPTLAANGYNRLAVTRDATGWPTDGYVGGEAFIQSRDLVFAATGAGFSRAISRLFLCQTQNGTTGDIIALSAAMPTELLIDPATPLVSRTFNYRIYER